MTIICENCGCSHDGTYGSGRFCSPYCARCFSSKGNRDKISQKISDTLKKRSINPPPGTGKMLLCNNCGRLLSVKNKCGYCYKCRIKLRICKCPGTEIMYVPITCAGCGKKLSIESKSGYCNSCIKRTQKYKDKMRQLQLSLVATGKHKGWISRKVSSYAEKFFTLVLQRNHIEYEQEKHVGPYFLDFAIGDIDLEIDGKQHRYEDRKLHDTERDDYLRKQGYFVYRVAWNEINTPTGKEMMKDKIDLFIAFYEAFCTRV